MRNNMALLVLTCVLFAFPSMVCARGEYIARDALPDTRPHLVTETRLLAQDTVLHFQQANNQLHGVAFKGGTQVGLDDRGFVVSGVLAKAETLRFDPSNGILCPGGATVTFFIDGYLESATLGQDFPIPLHSGGHLICKGGHPVSFLRGGKLGSGTLTQNFTLVVGSPPYKVVCQAGTEIRFIQPTPSKVELEYCTLAEAVTLPISKKVFPPGTFFHRKDGIDP